MYHGINRDLWRSLKLGDLAFAFFLRLSICIRTLPTSVLLAKDYSCATPPSVFYYIHCGKSVALIADHLNRLRSDYSCCQN